MRELSALAGLGEKRLKALSDIGVRDIPGLLNCLPRGYLNAEEPRPIAGLRPAEVCIEGKIKVAPSIQYYGGRSTVRARVYDDSGEIALIWFNQPWMAKLLSAGQKVLLYGKVNQVKSGLVLQNPKLLKTRGILPQYKPLPGLPPKVFSNLIEQALDEVAHLKDPLPDSTIKRFNLFSFDSAMRFAHRPKNMGEVALAQRRLAFENLLLFQMAIRQAGAEAQAGPDMGKAVFSEEEYWAKLPFKPTGAQKETLKQIVRDMKQPVAMRRLVQGDVGSGKTAVAFGAAMLAISAGYQCALMAPTEMLARQHHQNAMKLLQPFGVTCGLLLGSMKTAERREVLKGMADGSIRFIIGTHAIISQGVTYHNLGLAVTDEQHRFGVRQRQSLAERAGEVVPHILALSATPIPRSLALVLYGDLKVSVMDELPPGRTPVKTRIVPEDKREALYGYILEKAKAGEQSYLVCPLIEDSEDEDSDRQSAVSLYNRLKKTKFKDIPVALTYGSQKEEEKNQAMDAFYAGEAMVLVSTTVIEVGVDVPNATTMVIEDAENFGLAQLHQLRGRVGRGKLESWCFLLGEPNERLNTLVSTNDGFEIARADLEQRGPGEFLGTRQHGKLLNVYGINDMRLVEETARYISELEEDTTQKETLSILSELAKSRFDREIGTTGLH